MTTRARAGSDWLLLREPADAAARASDLVTALRPSLRCGAGAVIHDLGCGTGSMARWLSSQLPGPQHWVLHDRDAELLVLAAADPPYAAADGAPVTVKGRLGDITRLGSSELAGARLITASALLDTMTGDELDRLLASSAGARCPVLFALTVTGQVALAPADPFDELVREAFNAHQRRSTGAGRLLGPDAAGAAVQGFRRLGLDVTVRPSPWQLGPSQAALVAEWFLGWLRAACEQRPDLLPRAAAYARRRLDQAAAGRLSVTVHHLDLLALPR